MSLEERKIMDVVASILADSCFQRKGKLFYKVADRVAFCIAIEHPGLYYVRHFVIPLYLPQERINYTYGKRLNTWWDGKKDGENFLTQVSIGIKKDILPFFNRIGGIKQLFSFVQQDYKYVSSYFSCPEYRISLLVAYTALLLHNEKVASDAVAETRKLLSDTSSYSPTVISQIQNELCNIEKKALLSKPEIDHYYQEQITQSIHRCFPKHKL